VLDLVKLFCRSQSIEHLYLYRRNLLIRSINFWKTQLPNELPRCCGPEKQDKQKLPPTYGSASCQGGDAGAAPPNPSASEKAIPSFPSFQGQKPTRSRVTRIMDGLSLSAWVHLSKWVWHLILFLNLSSSSPSNTTYVYAFLSLCKHSK
jgi:hypothetical protein